MGERDIVMLVKRTGHKPERERSVLFVLHTV